MLWVLGEYRDEPHIAPKKVTIYPKMYQHCGSLEDERVRDVVRPGLPRTTVVTLLTCTQGYRSSVTYILFQIAHVYTFCMHVGSPSCITVLNTTSHAPINSSFK